MKFIKPSPKAVLSFDVGEKRIGLAYCDSLFITVSILPAIKRGDNFEEINLIKQHILSHNIKGIIIGLPLDENGYSTKQSMDCEEYGKTLIKLLAIPFNFVNEHSSTWETVNTYGIKKDKTGLVDSYSAKIILEQWIKEGPELKQYVFNNQIKH